MLIVMTLHAVSASAQDGSDAIMQQAADAYAHGRYAEAVDCYRRAAVEKSDVQAQFYLGYAYYNGEGTDRDYATAVMWFKRAAAKGHAKAQYNLAYCYMKGNGVPANYDKAFELLRQSARGGCEAAQTTLQECYEKGILEPERQSSPSPPRPPWGR